MKGKKKKVSASVTESVTEDRSGDMVKFLLLFGCCVNICSFFFFFFSMRDTRVCSNVDGRDPEGESFVMSNRWNYLGGKWYGI